MFHEILENARSIFQNHMKHLFFEMARSNDGSNLSYIILTIFEFIYVYIYIFKLDKNLKEIERLKAHLQEYKIRHASRPQERRERYLAPIEADIQKLEEKNTHLLLQTNPNVIISMQCKVFF